MNDDAYTMNQEDQKIEKEEQAGNESCSNNGQMAAIPDGEIHDDALGRTHSSRKAVTLRRPLARQIADRRRELRLTQGILAQQLGVTQHFVYLVEAGRRPIPPERATEIADLLLLNRADFCRALVHEQLPDLYEGLFGNLPLRPY
jgi:DNA-binding XRE family transcriptional regulator